MSRALLLYRCTIGAECGALLTMRLVTEIRGCTLDTSLLRDSAAKPSFVHLSNEKIRGLYGDCALLKATATPVALLRVGRLSNRFRHATALVADWSIPERVLSASTVAGKLP